MALTGEQIRVGGDDFFAHNIMPGNHFFTPSFEVGLKFHLRAVAMACTRADGRARHSMDCLAERRVSTNVMSFR